MSQPAPGWYPDPAGSQRLRWWNGGEWTEQFHDMPQQGASVAQQMPIAQAAGQYMPANTCQRLAEALSSARESRIRAAGPALAVPSSWGAHSPSRA